MTQDMADWIDQRDTVMHAFGVTITDTAKTVEKLRSLPDRAEDADRAEGYRQRQIAKRDEWQRAHEANKPRA